MPANVWSRRTCEQIAEPHSVPRYMTRAWRGSGGTQTYITQAPLCRILGSLIGRRWSWWKRRALTRQWVSYRGDPNALSELAKPGLGRGSTEVRGSTPCKANCPCTCDLVLFPIVIRAQFGESLKLLRAEIGAHVARSVGCFLAACRHSGAN
jgi:hypothetical protein